MTPFLQLVFSLMVIITAAKTGGWLANRLRQPAVLGELLVGVFLGPSVLDLLHWPFLANPVDPHLLTEAVYELAELGVVCLMFLAGLEVDIREMQRAGRVATLAGVSGVIVPLALGALVMLPFGYQGNAALFVGMILTATSVSISAQTLLELGMLRSREGIALLGAAEVVVVGEGDAGGDEAVVADRGECGDVGLGLDLAFPADGRLVLNGDAPADDCQLAYGDVLSDRGKVTDEDPISQDGSPVDDTVGADGDGPAKNEGGKDTGVSRGS